MSKNKFNQLVTKIIDGYQTNSGGNYLVGISGIDCSGKSTLAYRLEERLNMNNIPVQTVHGDDFLFDRVTRNKNPNQEIGYYAETFDYDKLFNELLIPMKSNRTLDKDLILLNWMNDKYTKVKFQVRYPSVIIVEGVFLFKKNLPDIFDFKIWIDISFEEGLQRALNRTRDQNYYGDPELIRQRYTERFYKGQKLHLKIDNPIEKCDLIIGG